MTVRVVEGARVRVGYRTIVALALCAAAMGAAVAHLAIDVVGDYALTRDSYDHLQHGSREVVAGVALLVALLLAGRGLRVCCDIAANNRARLLRPSLRLREIFGILFGAAGASVVIVPAMEYLDGRLDGISIVRFGDAFGGSIPLGLSITFLSAMLVAVLVCAIARWLIAHRDSIATIIGTFLRSFRDAARTSGYDCITRRLMPRRQRLIYALRLAKRGPPATRFA
jgi:hypothetical protein